MKMPDIGRLIEGFIKLTFSTIGKIASQIVYWVKSRRRRDPSKENYD